MEFSVQFPSSSSILNDSCNAWRVVTLLAATHSHHLTCTYLYHLMPSAASASRFHLDCRVRRLDFDEIYPNQLKDFEIKAGLSK